MPSSAYIAITSSYPFPYTTLFRSHGNLHAVIDFLPLHHHDRVRVGGIEEVAQRLSKVVVALVLDLVNTDEKRPHRFPMPGVPQLAEDRKSTRLNSSH